MKVAYIGARVSSRNLILGGGREGGAHGSRGHKSTARGGSCSLRLSLILLLS